MAALAATQGVVDARAPIGASPTPKVVLAGAADRPGWAYVTAYRDEHIRQLEGIPGVRFEAQRILVPDNVLRGRPDLFEAHPAWPAAGPSAHALDLAAQLPRTLSARDDSGAVLTLHDYQRAGVLHLLQPVGGVLGDSVGCGKTLQAALAAVQASYERVLVVGTLAARSIWCGERSDPRRWLGIEPIPLEGVKDQGLDGPPGGGWRFIHYDLIQQWFPYLTQTFRPECVIFDEAHKLDGHRTRRARTAIALTRLSTIQSRMVLTATQVRKELGNLWVILDVAQPDAWGRHFEFCNRYDFSARGPYGWLFGDKALEFFEAQGIDPDEHDRHEDELDARLRATLLRRSREEVQADLPPTIRTAVDVDLPIEQRRDYDAAERDVLGFLRARGGDAETRVAGAHLQQITLLASLVSVAKIPFTVEQARDDLAAHGRVVVFTWFKEAAAAIAQALKKDATVFGPTTGDTPQRVRAKRAGEFRLHQPPAVFVATLLSCGESINDLVAAHVGIMHDLYWEPWPFIQGEGRLRRTGQPETVLWRYMRARGTIEDHQVNKLMLAAEAVERGHGGRAALAIVGSVGDRPTRTEDPLADLIQELLARTEVRA